MGLTLGTADGTGPDDDPLLRAESLEGHAMGRAKGRAETQTAVMLDLSLGHFRPV